jgi:hypothetical protein
VVSVHAVPPQLPLAGLLLAMPLLPLLFGLLALLAGVMGCRKEHNTREPYNWAHKHASTQLGSVHENSFALWGAAAHSLAC